MDWLTASAGFGVIQILVYPTVVLFDAIHLVSNLRPAFLFSGIICAFKA
jgi:hypothetical protein